MPDWSKDPLHWIQWYAGLSKECIKDAGHFDECNLVWGVIGLLLGVVCGLGLLAFAVHFLRERAAYRRAWQRRLAEGVVAAPEEMDKHRWQADGAADPGLDKKEMTRLIREAKIRKRFENAPAADTAKGDKSLGIDPLHR